MKPSKNTTLAELVVEDLGRAAVLDRFGLDFYCAGDETFLAACVKNDLNPSQVWMALMEHDKENHARSELKSMPLPELIDDILTVHHDYLRSRLPQIHGHCRRLLQRREHGQGEFLLAVAQEFYLLSERLQHVMYLEESVLFPYIRKLVEADSEDGQMPSAAFPSVRYPIAVVEQEHLLTRASLQRLRKMTDGYSLPAGEDSSYAGPLRKLEQCEGDLHLHLFKENFVLHPRAIALEDQLKDASE